MAGLDFLTTGAPPPTQTTNQAAQRTLPDWYNSYIQGIAGKAASIADQPYEAYPGQRIADFNDDQEQAFDTVRNNQGLYIPGITNAQSTVNNAVPGVTSGLDAAKQYGTAATGAVAGPAQSWTAPGVADQYMSPYTKNVTDEIQRLGNRNLTENIIPGVQSNFVGSGQFGSSRNATILGQAVRDAQTDITGQQSLALQAGYGTAAGIFGADANREQQQEGLQASTNLGAGNLATSGVTAGANAASTLGSTQGALTQLQQTLGENDATSLGAVGGQEQSLEQQGYDASKAEFDKQQGWDWSQLGKVQGAVQGAQLPTGTTASTNAPAPGAGYGTSPLGWVSALTGLLQSNNP